MISKLFEIIEAPASDPAKSIVDDVLPASDHEDAHAAALRKSALTLTASLIRETRRSAPQCLDNARPSRQELLSYLRSGSHSTFSSYARDKNFSKSVQDTTRVTADCLEARLVSRVENIVSSHGQSSPLALDLRRRVGLSNKIAAASQDMFWQAKLSRHGYLWEDFYRPMTFEAVLLSLTARTRSHPANRVLDYLESVGVMAGALVGMDQISTSFGQEGFAQRVAVTTGVVVPELRKLFMKDIDLYLSNLATTALPSILTLAANESRDGYVFFPRGPIFGYGIDEFSISDPSFIVNIDNEDVTVDGALIESEVQFSAGQQSVDSAVATARNVGQKQFSERLEKLADLQAKTFAYQARFAIAEVCELLAAGQPAQARARYNWFARQNGADAVLLEDLKSRIDNQITCDATSAAPSTQDGETPAAEEAADAGDDAAAPGDAESPDGDEQTPPTEDEGSGD